MHRHALAILAAAALGLSAARAQEAEPAPPASAAPALPDKPIPYRVYTGEARPARAAVPTRRPAAAPRATAAATPAPLAPTAPTAARLVAGEPIAPAVLEPYVDGIVRQAMADGPIAGAAVAVVQNGQVILKKGYGYAKLGPGWPVDPDHTLFRIGSISKTFTWIAVMREIEAGRMRLDAPVNLYLPQKLQLPDQGFDQPVRLRDLMTHTAGFEDRALGSLFEFDAAKERPLATWLRQERPRRVRPPGQTPAYSNYGAALAGMAVSNVAGKPYEQLVEDEIIRPLGLARTTFREPRPPMAGLPAPMPAALARDLSDGFSAGATGLARRDFEFLGHAAPAGSASSTAADMARYMLALLGGGALDGATIYGPRAAQAFATPLDRTQGGGLGWRHGFMEFALPGGRTGWGHGGDTLAFHGRMVLVPELGLGVFVVVNTDAGAPLTALLPGEIVRRFYGPALDPQPGSPALAAMRKAFAGEYVSTRRPARGLESFVMRLAGATARVAVTDDGKLLLVAGKPQVFTPVSDPTEGRFRAWDTGEPLSFAMRDGDARSILTPIARYDRVDPLHRLGLLVTLVGLGALAAVATLVGLCTRDRRDVRETPAQARASLLQTTQAVLWLAGFFLAALWASGATNVESLLKAWPGGLLITASACWLVAALLAVMTAAMLPMVWRGGRRLDSWTPGRRLRFTATSLIFLALGIVMALWGALEPWTS